MQTHFKIFDNPNTIGFLCNPMYMSKVVKSLKMMNAKLPEPFLPFLPFLRDSVGGGGPVWIGYTQIDFLCFLFTVPKSLPARVFTLRLIFLHTHN